MRNKQNSSQNSDRKRSKHHQGFRYHCHLAMVIPNDRVHYTFKRTVRKFGTYLNKKLKVDNLWLLAPKTVNFLLQMR